MFDLVFNFGVGLSLYMALFATARESLRERMRSWLALDRERTTKACIAAVPALLIVVAFQTLIVGPVKLTHPAAGTITLLAICLLVPMIEEWVRGEMIAFCNECGSVLVGLLISSAFFALLHSLKLDLIYARAFSFGLLAGLLTLWSKGIMPSVLVHVFANMLIVSMAPA